MEERDKEQIKFHIEILRMCAIGIVAIGGGVVSMIINKPGMSAKTIIIAFGMIN